MDTETWQILRQKTALERVRKYLSFVKQQQENGNTRYASLAAWDELRIEFQLKDLNYQRKENGLSRDVPNFVLKIPTGGGKIDRFTPLDVEENLVVYVLMLQAAARNELAQKDLRIFSRRMTGWTSTKNFWSRRRKNTSRTLACTFGRYV